MAERAAREVAIGRTPPNPDSERFMAVALIALSADEVGPPEALRLREDVSREDGQVMSRLRAIDSFGGTYTSGARPGAHPCA